MCPHCGHLRAICGTPDGLTGAYHISQHVCYPTAIRDRTRRTVDKKFEKTDPDISGFLPTDGVSISVDLVERPGEDYLGLEEPSSTPRPPE